MKAQPIVRLAEDVLMENILDAFLGQSKLRHENIITAQGRFELQVHSGYNGIRSLFVNLCKAHAQTPKKKVASMFNIMKVVGVVYDSLNVAFVVANFHLCFENIVHIDMMF